MGESKEILREGELMSVTTVWVNMKTLWRPKQEGCSRRPVSKLPSCAAKEAVWNQNNKNNLLS